MAETGNKKLMESGIPEIQDAFFVIVRTEWNAAIVDELEKGCKKKLSQNGVEQIITITAPGAFELPFTIRSFWESQKYKKPPQAFIALGCVLRGDTPHFDYICKGVSDGIMHLNLTLPVPVIFGVLTVDNQKQAEERIGGKHGHKGEEAAMTALKMVALRNSFKRGE